MEVGKFLCRASQAGHIMPSEKARVAFTDTHIDKLVEMYNAQFFHRQDSIKSKYLDKGNEREEDSITLLSLVMGKMFRKNTTRNMNEYLTGEHDLDEVEDLRIVHTLDTKSSYSKITFDKARIKPINKVYWWQGQCYMALTGAKKHTLAYCLVNGTYEAIEKEKNALRYRVGMMDEAGNLTANGKKEARQIEINHIFDLAAFQNENPHYVFENDLAKWVYDIPKEQRVFTTSFERDDAAIQQLYRRIEECRAFMETSKFFKLVA